MAGVKGRSGAPGVPKTAEHRRRLSESQGRYWDSEEGQAVRAALQEAYRRVKVSQVMRAAQREARERVQDNQPRDRAES